jgi:hypothetical protein
MRPTSFLRRASVAAFGLLPLLGCDAPSADEQPAASPAPSAPIARVAGAPDGVPADFVVTPNGYFHPSCLVEVRENENVAEGGDILTADGSIRAVPACEHPRYDRLGRVIGAKAQGGMHVETLPGIGHAWLADFSQFVPGVTWQAASFRVPSAPIHYGNEVVFFFNALEPWTGNEIIQPVLQWNQYGYANAWTIASWYVDRTGRGYYSTPVRVNPGDTIGGYMYPSGTGRWFIGMTRNGSYATGYYATSSSTFNFVFGGAMEVYNVSSCEDLPSSGYEFFTSEATYQNGVPITPSWSTWMASGVSPNCNVSPFAGTTTGGMTWLYE